MASLLAPRRTRSRITLSATEARADGRDEASAAALPKLGWMVAAAVGALVCALAGWVLTAGLSVVGWLADTSGSLLDALGVGTEVWLLANGAGARLGGLTVTLVPWGVTLLVAFMLSRTAAFAARLAADPPRTVVLGVAVVTTTTYLAVLVPVALLRGHALEVGRGAVIMTVVAGGAAVWGASRAAGWRPSAAWPPWARQIPRAVLAAQVVLLIVGTGLLVTSAVLHLGRIESLLVALDAGVAGNIALLAVQLAYVPTAVVWSASYAIGAGFGLGAGSLVAPAGTSLGVLPALPLLGAVPGTGPASADQVWWLAGGVLAGAVAAAVVVLTRRDARFDETSLVGGLSGALAGGVFVVVAWLSRGALGAVRLAELGPRLGELALLAVCTLGLSGLAAGLVLGLARRYLLPASRRGLARLPWPRGRHRS